MRADEAAAAKAAQELEPLAARFAGQTALIFAPGPSLTKLWSPERPIPFPSIVINDAWHIAPTADILYAADLEWWIRREAAPGFKGQRVSADGTPFRHVISLQVNHVTPIAFDSRLGWLCSGGNSGYGALHLAAQLGATRIVLVGYDMRKVNGERHYAGHPTDLRADSNYCGWIVNFRELAKILTKRGVEVLNATPGSDLNCFPAVKLEEDICPVPSVS